MTKSVPSILAAYWLRLDPRPVEMTGHIFLRHDRVPIDVPDPRALPFYSCFREVYLGIDRDLANIEHCQTANVYILRRGSSIRRWIFSRQKM